MQATGWQHQAGLFPPRAPSTPPGPSNCQMCLPVLAWGKWEWLPDGEVPANTPRRQQGHYGRGRPPRNTWLAAQS